MEYCRLDIGIYFFQKVDVGQGALKPGDSAVIFSRAMDLKCAKGEPSNAFINIIIIIFAIIITIIIEIIVPPPIIMKLVHL